MGSDPLGRVTTMEVAQVPLPPDIAHVTSGAADARDVLEVESEVDLQVCSERRVFVRLSASVSVAVVHHQHSRLGAMLLNRLIVVLVAWRDHGISLRHLEFGIRDALVLLQLGVVDLVKRDIDSAVLEGTTAVACPRLVDGNGLFVADDVEQRFDVGLQR